MKYRLRDRVADWTIWFRDADYRRRRKLYRRTGNREYLRSQHFTRRPCVECKRLTIDRRLVVDPATLRRQFQPLCDDCRYSTMFTVDRAQEKARKRRTEHDWSRPIPDQFPGVTRTTIRDFLQSDKQEVVLEETKGTAAELNSSIATLGMHNDVYGEIRSGRVVLRRLQDGKAAAV